MNEPADALLDQVTSLAELLPSLLNDHPGEGATKEWLIRPIIDSLGYRGTDVYPEFQVGGTFSTT